MTALTAELTDQIKRWLAQDPDPATAEALRVLHERAAVGDREALTELTLAFAGPLRFGTAGLRGPLGPGPGRMNRLVVAHAAAGFAAWLRQQGCHEVDGARGKVLIGYDARYNSEAFARESAEIFAGAGFEPLLCEQNTPTPVVAFGIQHFGCVAGVVVTASHNPPADNGYKVYLGDGSQIVPPTDAEIATFIDAVAEGSYADIPRDDSITMIGDELVAAYLERAATLVPADTPRTLRWGYTAMHGVGARVVLRVADRLGFPAPHAVSAQQEPNPAFPTVAFPNPEEPGAMDLALDLARQTEVDLVIANDPDADRCAVAINDAGTWRILRGDELGALLGDYALRCGRQGTYACSIVSSTLLGRMAATYDQPFAQTLTGFKWIGRVPGLAFGYEEAIGYCCDPDAVPDKDGITALVRVLALAAELKAEGKTIADRLAEIMTRYGLHATDQLSVRVMDLTIISDAMARLRANPPAELLGEPVTVIDLKSGGDLPPTDAVELSTSRVHVVVRPSGTEPKLKCYIEYRQTPVETADLSAARARAAEALAALRAELSIVLGLN